MKKTEYIPFVFLVVISLFVNLGLAPLYHEEPRRALIALEMLFSGDYITPTVMGEPYFAKPPVFNWLLILSYRLFGSFSEFAVRFPSVLSLLLIGLFNFLFLRKFLDRRIAFYSSMGFITCGSIYFYFSLLGEIDIFYSLVMYLCIISIFLHYESGHYLRLFLSSFSLAAVAFLTKGFPSLAFLYVSLLVFFAAERKLKKMFSLEHLLGVTVFVLISGVYLYLYHLQNPVGPYLDYLWSESSRRTIFENTPRAFMHHLIRFPLETLTALLPYTFLGIFAFRKDFVEEVMSVPVLRFSLLVTVPSYLIYLLSPGANQRYIYVLFPLFIPVLCFAYFRYRDQNSLRRNATDYFVRALLVAIAAGAAIMPFLSIIPGKPYVFLVSLFLFIAALSALRISMKRRDATLAVLLSGLIILRFGFDAVYLPVQASKLRAAEVRRISEQIVDMTRNGHLYFYGDSKLFEDLTDYIFYIEKGRREILRCAETIHEGDYFIAEDDSQEEADVEKLLTFMDEDQGYSLFRY